MPRPLETGALDSAVPAQKVCVGACGVEYYIL